MPNQGTLIFFWVFFRKILDFFEPGEKKKIVFQNPETLIQPVLKKGNKIPFIPVPKVFIDFIGINGGSTWESNPCVAS